MAAILISAKANTVIEVIYMTSHIKMKYRLLVVV
jgi:hypothetical protein